MQLKQTTLIRINSVGKLNVKCYLHGPPMECGSKLIPSHMKIVCNPSCTCHAHVICPPKLEVFHMENNFNTIEILQPTTWVFDVILETSFLELAMLRLNTKGVPH